jgi:hypothetical protein
MQDLALHRQDKKYNPVAQKYGPEDRNVEYREESHHKSYHKSFCDCIPEMANKYYGMQNRIKYKRCIHREAHSACFTQICLLAKASF